MTGQQRRTENVLCASERSVKLIWFGRLVDLRSGASLVISPADDKSGFFI
jgi:hypothetical protein